MKLSIVIDALRDRVPEFQQRVHGAAEFEDGVRDGSAPFDLPAAFVLPLDEERTQGFNRHVADVYLVERFAVVLAIRQRDRRGEAAVNDVHDLRAKLLRALHGWQAVPENGLINFDGGTVIGMNRDRLFYQYDFAQEVRFGPQDGYIPACDEFDRAALRVDQQPQDGTIDIGADVTLP